MALSTDKLNKLEKELYYSLMNIANKVKDGFDNITQENIRKVKEVKGIKLECKNF